MIADRHDKRRLLMLTQTLMAIPALSLLGLTAAGAIEPWMVFALVFARGIVCAIDNPTRQAFVIEMVGRRPAGQRRHPQQRDRPLRPGWSDPALAGG